MEDTMEIKFCGIKEIEYKVPDWNEDDENPDMEEFFSYNESDYFLSEFMSLHNKIHMPNPPERFKGFDGYMSCSFFDGYLVKIIESGDAVKLYHYSS